MSVLFSKPHDIRLVTIIAHVDHGKSSLADHLIESNGLLSERQAGIQRYLDSHPEEQRRGITMRASAIGLKHLYQKQEEKRQLIIHLVDSPGHADFGQQVSSSLLACDGCLLVIDVVEGMGARTHQVMREAFSHQLVPLLVFNKIDRLCCELKLSPTEAYLRLRSLLETVNAAASAMLTSAEASDQLQRYWTFTFENIVFASALFGWGFSVPALCRSLYRQGVVPVKPMQLKQFLFGDFKLKDGKIVKWKQGEPLFAKFALEPLWNIYEAVATAARAVSSNGVSRTIQSETPGMEQVLKSLQTGATGTVPTNTTELQAVLAKGGSHSEEVVLRALLRRYRPLADAVLNAATEILPSPAEAPSIRSRALALRRSPLDEPVLLSIRSSVAHCDPQGPTVAHVCHFCNADPLHVPDVVGKTVILLGVTRVLSGTLRSGSEYYVIGPNHQEGDTLRKHTITCYLSMGSAFVKVDQVPAGHLCAVYDLEGFQFTTLTLCDSQHGTPLVGYDRQVQPLVKVSVEPENAVDTDALERGLMRLKLVDASVEVTSTRKGERLLSCLGELHLEQSLLDLSVYCEKDIKLRISDPIVDFGETTDWFDNENDFRVFYDDRSQPLRQVSIPPYNEEDGVEYARRGRMRALLSSRAAALHVRLLPLDSTVFRSLEDKRVNDDSLDELARLGRSLGMAEYDPESVLQALLDSLISLGANGTALVETPGLRIGHCVRGVVASPEVYVPSTGNVDDDPSATAGKTEYESLCATIHDLGFRRSTSDETVSEVDQTACKTYQDHMRGSLQAGFESGIRAGPICEEPIFCSLVVVEGVEVALSSSILISSGLVLSAMLMGIRCSLLSRPARLIEGHLKLTLHTSLHGLGALYQVLNKRRGKVLDDSMVDGTDLIMITALLPQAEAFGLAPELSSKTSGEVTLPEMVFSHWEMFHMDPFWIPTTEEEREDFGELESLGDASTGMTNTALQYIRRVRSRKGLRLDSTRTVVAAEKQRTLKR